MDKKKENNRETKTKGGFTMTCDICDNREAEYFGRWVAWCSKCKDQGKSKDRQMVIDNELSPDIESGDFSYTLEQGLGDYLI